MKNILLLLTWKERYAVDETDKWMKGLQDFGIKCVLKDMSGQNAESEEHRSRSDEEWIPCLFEYGSDDTLVLTDSREISRVCTKWKYVCIGLDPLLETFFDGAESVVTSMEDLDYIYMEETFLRAKGFPVLIAETERFRIREIQKEDIQALYEISRQDGMEYAYADQEQAKCFERERMESYISTVYRFYGYGLWTAETLSGEIIGCCGFSDFCMTEHIADKTEELLVLYKDIKHDTEHDTEYDTENPETESGLELQYFTANRFQNQGYGTEMCRAAIKYAQERLTLCRLYVRVYAKNTASVRVAEKLGFRYLETEWS